MSGVAKIRDVLKEGEKERGPNLQRMAEKQEFRFDFK